MAKKTLLDQLAEAFDKITESLVLQSERLDRLEKKAGIVKDPDPEEDEDGKEKSFGKKLGDFLGG